MGERVIFGGWTIFISLDSNYFLETRFFTESNIIVVWKRKNIVTLKQLTLILLMKCLASMFSLK